MQIPQKEQKNGLELSFDSILRGKDGVTHRQKVMNKYLNIVDIPPVDGCDVIASIDVSMQDICEKALLTNLRRLTLKRRCCHTYGSSNRRDKGDRKHDKM